MSLPSTQIQTPRKKASKNSLEVEHLLEVASIGDVSDIKLLRELKSKHDWSDSGWEGKDRVVPLGRWVDVVCCYLESGTEGIHELVHRKPEFVEFSIGLLESIPTAESVKTLLTMKDHLLSDLSENLLLAVRFATAFNLLLGFQTAPEISKKTTSQVRGFLHQLLKCELTEAQQATCICALRGVGNEESLTLLETMTPLTGIWAGTESIVRKQIQKRLRRG